MSAWPYDQPKNCAALTTTDVIKGGQDILYVFHDEEDHGWQFHHGGAKKVTDAMVVALEEIVAHDPSVLEVADLPPGWKAWRESRNAPWQRAKNKAKN